ncbi:hypothetical protein MMPV_005430 [Pyropia vietnamensis]
MANPKGAPRAAFPPADASPERTEEVDEDADKGEDGGALPAALPLTPPSFPFSARTDTARHPHAHPGGGILFPPSSPPARRHRSAVAFLLRSLGSSLLTSGPPDLSCFSLPVHLFESRSFLTRLLDDWSAAPAYLDAAAAVTTMAAAASPATPTGSATRALAVAAVVVAGLRKSATLGKPFNPLLGETAQVAWATGSGAAIQASHHPPVSEFVLAGAGWTARGWCRVGSRLLVLEGAVRTRRLGGIAVTFAADGAVVRVTRVPYLVARGVLGAGDRRIEYMGGLSVEDPAAGVVVDIEVGRPPPAEGDGLPGLGDGSALHAADSAAATAAAPAAAEATVTAADTTAAAAAAAAGEPQAGPETVAAVDPPPPVQPPSPVSNGDGSGGDRRTPLAHRTDAQLAASVAAPDTAAAVAAAGLDRTVLGRLSGSWLSHLDVELVDGSIAGGNSGGDVGGGGNDGGGGGAPTQRVRPATGDGVWPTDGRFRPDVRALAAVLAAEGGEWSDDDADNDHGSTGMDGGGAGGGVGGRCGGGGGGKAAVVADADLDAAQQVKVAVEAAQRRVRARDWYFEPYLPAEGEYEGPFK